jgi:hypothetical protein
MRAFGGEPLAWQRGATAIVSQRLSAMSRWQIAGFKHFSLLK